MGGQLCHRRTARAARRCHGRRLQDVRGLVCTAARAAPGRRLAWESRLCVPKMQGNRGGAKSARSRRDAARGRAACPCGVRPAPPAACRGRLAVHRSPCGPKMHGKPGAAVSEGLVDKHGEISQPCDHRATKYRGTVHSLSRRSSPSSVHASGKHEGLTDSTHASLGFLLERIAHRHKCMKICYTYLCPVNRWTSKSQFPNIAFRPNSADSLNVLFETARLASKQR